MNNRNSDDLSWKDIHLDEMPGETREEKIPEQGPGRLRSLSVWTVALLTLAVLLLGTAIVLYVKMSGLRSEMRATEGRLQELAATNEQLKADLKRQTARLEQLRGEKERAERERAAQAQAAAKAAQKPEQPKPAAKKAQPAGKRPQGSPR